MKTELRFTLPIIIFTVLSLAAAQGAVAAEDNGNDQGISQKQSMPQKNLEPLLWDDLSEAEQKILRNVEKNWDSLPPARQHRVLRGVRRWSAMDKDERRSSRQRLQRWQSLEPETRQQIREQYEYFKSLPITEQRRIRNALRTFRNMDPDRRKQLRDWYNSLSPADKARARNNMQQRIRQQRLRNHDRARNRKNSHRDR